MPVAEQSDTLGALLLYKEFQRDLPIYEGEAGWVRDAIKSFQTMPTLHQGKAIAADRLIAVLQGWGVSQDEIEAQIRMARQAGAASYVIAEKPIDQSWTPKIISHTHHQPGGAPSAHSSHH